MQNKRKIAKELLQYYLSNPGRFSILIFGERGTGKSKSVKDIAKTMNIHEDNFIEISCASFTDDNIAEVELFGVKKGIFTGVYERKGVFEKAKNGILFFDEIHTLSPRVQEKLMTTLQTEPNGNYQGQFSFSIVGETKKKYSNARVVFATNRTVTELKKELLPDFYDRIAQLIVEFPTLKETPETIENDFKTVWQNMKFEYKNEIPNIKELHKWIKRVNLSGNYRDIEKIAILWHQCRLMNFENEETIFEWVKQQIKTYHSTNNISNEVKFNFRKGKKHDELLREYKNAMYEWAIKNYSNQKEAAKALGYKSERLDFLRK